MIRNIELQGGPFPGLFPNAGLADDTTTHIGMQFLSSPENPFLTNQQTRMMRGHYLRIGVLEYTATFTWVQV